MSRLRYDKWIKSMSRAELLVECLRTVGDQLEDGIERSARGVYYDLVGEGLIPQDKRHPTTGQPMRKVYNRVVDTIAKAKLAGDFPLEWLRDDLRPVHHGAITSSAMDVDAAVLEVESYLRWLPGSLIKADRWYNQPIVPVVIVEKDTLVGTIKGPVNDAEIPWYVCRGYSSLTGLYALAKYLHDVRRGADWEVDLQVLYLGDHDPEGLNIPEVVEKRIAQIYELKGWRNPPGTWTRVALTYEQAMDLNAPPMVVKKDSARAKGYMEKFGDDTWEVEAMPSRMLQGKLREAIDDIFDDQIRTEVTDEFPDLRRQLKRRILDDGGELAERAFKDEPIDVDDVYDSGVIEEEDDDYGDDYEGDHEE